MKMILRQYFTTEIASSENLVKGSVIAGEDLNDSGVIHHNFIEAIHKEILLKSQQIGFSNDSEGFTFEGIVNFDFHESHYRVKTEILGNIGPVFAIEICTITNSVPERTVKKEIFKSCFSSSVKFEDLSDKLNFNVNCMSDLKCVGLESSNDSKFIFKESNDVGKNVISPIDYSFKLGPFDKDCSVSNDFKLPKPNISINPIEVLSMPLNLSYSRASGFGFSVKKRRCGDILNLFMCPLCIYFCLKRGELKKHHTAVHLDGKPYGCSYCPYRSTHKSTLRSHVMSQHTGERPFVCSQCDYRASQKGLVDKHIMTKHTGEKPFKCPHCDFSSSHSSTVKTHIMFKHTGEKPFECPHSQYRAVQRGHIVRHIKAVHSGEKPFKCPHCQYKACRNTNIKKHVMAVHSKEKPHHCPHCSFKSSHKGNLNSHMISKHTEMKPFPCQFCNYKSSCKTGLNKHLLKHINIKKNKLRCQYCTYSSDRKDHLRTHVTFVHFKGNKSLHNNNIKNVIDSEFETKVNETVNDATGQHKMTIVT